MQSEQIDELLTRGVANVIPSKEKLAAALQSGKPLNIYIGIDPTATKIHLGHAVPLRKLQKFAQAGLNVTFLIGDFTALIGDTSDKDSERPILTKDEIENNFQTYKKQADKVLDFSKIKVRHNSEWLSKLTFEEIIKLCQHFSVGDFISRELIRKRLDIGSRVALHEFLYPVMQGYDSYFMDTDVQLGGTDQTFNMQAGRTLQKNLRGKESFVLATEFLIGTDGRKMSKSWGNAIWLEDEPSQMYGKVMSIKDDLLISYFTLTTDVPTSDIKAIEQKLNQGDNPMQIKKDLAHRIVAELHGKEAADRAAEAFVTIVQDKLLPEDIPLASFHRTENDKINIIEFLVKANAASSNSEAKRLIEQGGIEIDGEKITNIQQDIDLREGIVVKFGKRKYIKVSYVD